MISSLLLIREKSVSCSSYNVINFPQRILELSNSVDDWVELTPGLVPLEAHKG